VTARARCSSCDYESMHPTYAAASTALFAHYDTAHTDRPAPAELHQLPAVEWHRQALQAIHALAATGEPFVIADVQKYGVTDPPQPRTDWPKVTAEAEQLGWIEHCGYAKSTRPTVRGSAVRQWRGTFAVRRAS